MLGINDIVWLCYFGLLGCFADSGFINENLIQIKLDSGILQGNIKRLENGQNYYNFQGIPFAIPPLGNLRFKDPVPYKKWNGVLNATTFGPSCVEIRLRQIQYSVTGQEDCLYLNVYTPQNPHVLREPLPVMIWVYGGSFREGSSNYYGPHYLMKENVVVVTFNYRLGVFGFLSTQDEYAPGNYGIKDTILALKWVKNNIVKFGGDPNRITLTGESAGGAMVGYLLVSSQTKNLFHAAIMQSGSPLCSWALHRNPKKVAFDLGLALGIATNSSSTLIKYLRGVDLPNAKQAMINVNLLNFAESFNNGGPFGPVLETKSGSALLTKDSYKALKNGNFHKVPILMGINSQESKFLRSLLVFTRPLFFLYDLSPSSLIRTTMNIKSVKDRQIAGRKIKEFYMGSDSFISGKDDKLAEFFSDDLFVRPITKTAQLLAKYVPVYFYVYDFEGPMGKEWLNYAAEDSNNVKGVGHATDLWYLWKAGWSKRELKTDDEKLASKRLVKLWTNFVAFGNPTPRAESLFNDLLWPTVKEFKVNYFHIGKTIQIDRNFKEQSLKFWNDLYANYSKEPFETF